MESPMKGADALPHGARNSLRGLLRGYLDHTGTRRGEGWVPLLDSASLGYDRWQHDNLYWVFEELPAPDDAVLAARLLRHTYSAEHTTLTPIDSNSAMWLLSALLAGRDGAPPRPEAAAWCALFGHGGRFFAICRDPGRPRDRSRRLGTSALSRGSSGAIVIREVFTRLLQGAVVGFSTEQIGISGPLPARVAIGRCRPPGPASSLC
ncbi:MAG: hypothetical protein ACI8S6_004850 [Myxococcota bacterium]|jgi:hypothetical protein